MMWSLWSWASKAGGGRGWRGALSPVYKSVETSLTFLVFNIFTIKRPNSEEKLKFRGRWVLVPESPSSQNFEATSWPMLELSTTSESDFVNNICNRCSASGIRHIFRLEVSSQMLPGSAGHELEPRPWYHSDFLVATTQGAADESLLRGKNNYHK